MCVPLLQLVNQSTDFHEMPLEVRRIFDLYLFLISLTGWYKALLHILEYNAV
jgi:hypothetical protein